MISRLIESMLTRHFCVVIWMSYLSNSSRCIRKETHTAGIFFAADIQDSLSQLILSFYYSILVKSVSGKISDGSDTWSFN